MKKWFALHTRPQAEQRVARLLAKCGIEAFVPGTRRGPKENVLVFRPLFPGYLFVHIDLNEQRAVTWFRFPDVRYLVAYGDEPIAVGEEVIFFLRQQMLERQGSEKRPGTWFKPDSLVRIKEGPFQGMLAIFEGPLRPNQRVQVLLHALERSVRLRLSPSGVEEAHDQIAPKRVKRPRRTRGRGRRINS